MVVKKLLLLFLALFCCVVLAHEKHTYAWTNQGIIRGLIKDHVQAFLGVPFAAPPERFKPPVPPPFRWHIFDATDYGAACPQLEGDEFILTEDCLNLNIFVPKHAIFKCKLPVLVYWDGGSFLFGGNRRLVNQAEQLAKEGNMIVVVANHRLGALGYLYLDELGQADGYKDNKVNFALLDAIRALHWVKHNIGYFGGDASSVTIGGLSSGAFTASWLTTIPQAWGLFRNVLQLEGPLTALVQAVVYPKATANVLGHGFTAAVNCTGDANQVMNCLATADLKTLVAAWQNFDLLPVVDGDLFPQNPDLSISNTTSGLVKPAPTLMIAVPNPGGYFAGPYVDLAAQIGWGNLLIALFGPGEVSELLFEQYSDLVYGNETEESLFARASNLISDAIWLCPLRRHATFLSAITPNVYVGTWNTRASFASFPPELGVVHGTEVPFLFGKAVDIGTYWDQVKGNFTHTEAKISKNFIAEVAHFVRTGKPRGTEFTAWTPEVNTLINPDGVPTISDVLFQIRTPPSGLGFPTRCELFDLFFQEGLAGELNMGKLWERFEKNGGNFWPGKRRSNIFKKPNVVVKQ